MNSNIKVKSLTLTPKYWPLSKIHVDIDTESLIQLTEYAVDGRYDIIHDDIEDTSKYIDVLKKLSIHVEKIIIKEED